MNFTDYKHLFKHALPEQEYKFIKKLFNQPNAWNANCNKNPDVHSMFMNSRSWYSDTEHNVLHRTEKHPITGYTLPALIFSSGEQKWFQDGKMHRTDIHKKTGFRLPALISPEFLSMEWVENGKLHRADTCNGFLLPASISVHLDTEESVELELDYYKNGNHLYYVTVKQKIKN